MRALFLALVLAWSTQAIALAAPEDSVPMEENSGLSSDARQERLKDFEQKRREFKQKWSALDKERKAERAQLREKRLSLMTPQQRAKAEARMTEWKSLTPEQRKARIAERRAKLKERRQLRRQRNQSGSAKPAESPTP